MTVRKETYAENSQPREAMSPSQNSSQLPPELNSGMLKFNSNLSSQ